MSETSYTTGVWGSMFTKTCGQFQSVVDLVRSRASPDDMTICENSPTTAFHFEGQRRCGLGKLRLDIDAAQLQPTFLLSHLLMLGRP